MRNTKLFIFDMDGLLVDSERFYSAGWKNAMESLGYLLDDEIYDSWIGQGRLSVMKFIKGIVKKDSIVESVFEMREKFIYESLYNGSMQELPKATYILEYLRNEGYKIGLSSSTSRKRGSAILEFLNLYAYIDYASFGDDVEYVKPSPLVYQRTLDISGFKPEEAIAIEDSYAGALAASKAGMNVIVVPYVDFEVDKIKTIENVITIANDLSIIEKLLNTKD